MLEFQVSIAAEVNGYKICETKGAEVEIFIRIETEGR